MSHQLVKPDVCGRFLPIVTHVQVSYDLDYFNLKALVVGIYPNYLKITNIHSQLMAMVRLYCYLLQRHNAYVDQLEQENREEKSTLHQLREKTADLTSRLMTAKSSCKTDYLRSCIIFLVILVEELQEVYEQSKAKHKEESRKLYNVSFQD